MSIPTEGKSIFETTLEQVNPNEGPTIGGIQLDISGTGFAVGATVSVKGVSASDVTVWSSTRITATLPKQPGFAGDAPIVVTNPDGSSARRSDLFRYYLGAFPFRAPLLELGDQAAQFADATAVATGDLNQDGVPDIAASGGIGVTLLLSNGRGGYAASNQIATGLSPIAVAIADLNVDGRPDVVVANRDSSTVSVLLNTGQAILSRTDFTVGQSPQDLAVRDVDGDGLLDVATRNSIGEVRVLLGNGRGGLGPSFADASGTVPTNAFTVSPSADVNGDGKLDPITLEPGITGQRAVALSLSGAIGNPGQDPWIDLQTTGSFELLGDTVPSQIPVAVGDVDRDGLLDLVAWTGASPTSSTGLFTVSFARRDLSSTVFYSPSQALSGPNVPPARAGTPLAFVLGDVNGDRYPDIVYMVSTNSEKFLAVALNDHQNRRFMAPSIIPHSSGLPAMVAGDWNRDGKLDVAFLSNSVVSGSPFGVFLGDGTGRFTVSFPVPTVYGAEGAQLIETGDFNGDGLQDLVTGDADCGCIYVYRGNGMGGFLPARQVSRRALLGINSLAVGDLNNDGRTDLVATAWNDTWHVFLGSESESLTAGVRYAAAKLRVAGVTIADFNNDRRPDVVVFGAWKPSRVYWGDGRGSFLGHTAFPNLGTFGIALDLNRDSLPDLITRIGSLARLSTRIVLGSAQ
jgi:hypothetical protein